MSLKDGYELLEMWKDGKKQNWRTVAPCGRSSLMGTFGSSRLSLERLAVPLRDTVLSLSDWGNVLLLYKNGANNRNYAWCEE